MLDELKRRSKLIMKNNDFDEWDWLIYAQHFGLKTRLLDWSSNPLIALWFACSNLKKDKNPVVYVFRNVQDYMLDKKTDKNPFTKSKTKVLKPTLNNPRIIAQGGWFTAHKYSSLAKKYVDFAVNPDVTNNIIEITVLKDNKAEILESLNTFGINSQSLFPDILGICQHLNWEFKV